MVFRIEGKINQGEDDIYHAVYHGVYGVHRAGGYSGDEVVNEHDDRVDAVDVDVQGGSGEGWILLDGQRVQEGEVDQGHLQSPGEK